MVNIVHFCLANQFNVLLFGKEGIGKTTAIGKVIDKFPKDARVLFLKLGVRDTFEQEDFLLRDVATGEANAADGDTFVIVEGFVYSERHHVAFVRSLLAGRMLYDEQRETFVQLSKITVCIEAIEPESSEEMEAFRRVLATFKTR